jgi:transcriptional regulator with XRE-family HTH domain
MGKPSMTTIRQVKAARALLGWSQIDLAEKSGVSIPTIERLEGADGAIGGRPETAEKIIAAFERAHIEFQNHGEPGVRLRKRSRRKD